MTVLTWGILSAVVAVGVFAAAAAAAWAQKHWTCPSSEQDCWR